MVLGMERTVSTVWNCNGIINVQICRLTLLGKGEIRYQAHTQSLTHTPYTHNNTSTACLVQVRVRVIDQRLCNLVGHFEFKHPTLMYELAEWTLRCTYLVSHGQEA